MKKEKGQYSLINTGSMASARVMRRLHRERLIEKHNIKRKASFAKSAGDPDFADTEFALPDESRNFKVNRIGPCPNCGFAVSELCKLLSVSEKASEVKKPRVPIWFVRCTHLTCEYRTLDFPTSQQAIQNWRVLSALTK